MTDTNEENNQKITWPEIKEQVKKDWANQDARLPNILSLSRIAAPAVIAPLALSGISIPITVGTVAFDGLFPLVLAIGGAFALTDFFDGKIARKRNAQTWLGEKLDPVCDKVMATLLTIPLIFCGMPYLAATLGLEAAIGGINILANKKGCEPKSNIMGKIKMWPLLTMLVASYGLASGAGSYIPHFAEIISGLFVATTVLEGINIAQYGKPVIQKYMEEHQQKQFENNNSLEDENNQLDKEKQIEEITSIQMLNDIKAELDARIHGYESKQDEIDLLKLTRDELTWTTTPPQTDDKVRVFKQK